MAKNNKSWISETTVVKNWIELNEALHSSQIVYKNPNSGNHYRSPFCFRGMANENWKLMTSLQRLGSEPKNVERPMLRSFRKFAKRGTFKKASDWEVAAIAQHNGLPTRILDWTASPLIAAHFATWDISQKDEDGVIWCLNVEQYKSEILPENLKIELNREKAWVFDLPSLENVFPSFSEFENLFDSDLLILFEPPSIDDRIQNQYGLFSAMNTSYGEIDNHLFECNKRANGLVKRVVIKAEGKQEIRDMLDENNINERMLFPGLPGLCEWLKRRFGPVD